MAQLNKLEFTLQDTAGNALSGVSVRVMKAGATVSGTNAGPAYTVNAPGAIEVGSVVASNVSLSFTRTVTVVAATTVTAGAVGLGTLNDGDRILIYGTASLPTIYSDSHGDDSTTNPLTTDANGRAYCWVNLSTVDVAYTKSGYANRFEYDRPASGPERSMSNCWSTSNTAYSRDTERTLTSGTIEEWLNDGSQKAAIDYAGNFQADGNATIAGNASVAGTLAVTGNVTLTADLTVDDITADDITCQDVTVTGTLTYSGVAGSLSLTAGSIETADLATNAVVVTRTADGTADDTLTAAAAYADITGATLTFTPASSTSEIVVMAYCPVTASAAANAYFQIADGSNNALAEGTAFFTNANSGEVGPLIYRVTGLTGSQTFKVRGKCTTANCTCPNSTNAAVKRVTRIIAMEFKK